MRLDSACKAEFARHETFHPRYGWVKKAYDAASTDPNRFNDEDAVVYLGVGKNMVKSIRFWGVAFRVIANESIPGSRAQIAEPTEFGASLLAANGWDPYCELPGTQWLLHWKLNSPGSRVPVWWLAFNEFAAVEFAPEELEQFVADRCRDLGNPNPNSIRKDVQCMLRMYSSGESVRATFDDLIDCPFRDLNLIRPSPSTPGAFRFVIGPKPTLPASIAAYAALDFISNSDSSSRVVNISRLATEHGGPGRVFKLPETELVRLLEEAAASTDGLAITSSAGAVQVAFDEDPAVVATRLLSDHYRRWSVAAESQTESTVPAESEAETVRSTEATKVTS